MICVKNDFLASGLSYDDSRREKTLREIRYQWRWIKILLVCFSFALNFAFILQAYQ